MPLRVIGGFARSLEQRPKLTSRSARLACVAHSLRSVPASPDSFRSKTRRNQRVQKTYRNSVHTYSFRPPFVLGFCADRHIQHFKSPATEEINMNADLPPDEPSELESEPAEPSDLSDLEYEDFPCTDDGGDGDDDDDSRWEVFIADDDERDPEPDPDDFGMESSRESSFEGREPKSRLSAHD